MKERHCLPINAGLLCEEMLTNLDTAKSKQILITSFIYISLLRQFSKTKTTTLIHQACFFSGIDLFLRYFLSNLPLLLSETSKASWKPFVKIFCQVS